MQDISLLKYCSEFTEIDACYLSNRLYIVYLCARKTKAFFGGGGEVRKNHNMRRHHIGDKIVYCVVDHGR